MKPLNRCFLASLMCSLAWLLLECCASGQTPGGQDNWVRLSTCPVLADKVVPIPAQETGILEELLVTPNRAVALKTPLARMDQDLAKTELELARLKYSLAKNLAEDESDIEYHRVALQQAELELENHKLLGRNVSESEVRRLTLAVGQAKLALNRARQAKARATMEAQIQFANIDLATKRLNRRTITAPMNGVVSDVICQPGEWIEAGSPVLELTNLEELKVDRLVPVGDVNLSSIVGSPVWIELVRLQPGSDANKSGDTKPKYLAGKIASFDHEISAQGYIRIHAAVQNRSEQGRWLLLPGMSVNLLIPKEQIRAEAATAVNFDPVDATNQVPATATLESVPLLKNVKQR